MYLYSTCREILPQGVRIDALSNGKAHAKISIRFKCWISVMPYVQSTAVWLRCVKASRRLAALVHLLMVCISS